MKKLLQTSILLVTLFFGGCTNAQTDDKTNTNKDQKDMKNMTDKEWKEILTEIGRAHV